jgi:prepilin-type N-terminal cleavage/methylation domain-containing protein
MKSKGFTLIEIAVVIVVMGLLAAGGYLLWQNPVKTTDSTKMSDADMAKMSPTPTATPAPTPDASAGWQTYTSIKYHYLIKYPVGFGFKDYSSHQDGSAIAINTLAGINGMQNTEPYGARISVASGVAHPLLERSYYGKPISESEITSLKVGGLKGERWSSPDGSFTEIAVAKDNLTYMLFLSGIPSPSVTDFNLMVDSFTFTK